MDLKYLVQKHGKVIEQMENAVEAFFIKTEELELTTICPVSSSDEMEFWCEDISRAYQVDEIKEQLYQGFQQSFGELGMERSVITVEYTETEIKFVVQVLNPRLSDFLHLQAAADNFGAGLVMEQIEKA